MMRAILFLIFCLEFVAHASVWPGVDVFFEDEHVASLEGKRVALLTNHTGIDRNMRPTLSRLKERVNLTVLFSPEHGLKGQHYAWDSVAHGNELGIPVYSLHGETRRPKPEMLENLDVVIYDIQCTGVRAYTYPTTLFYMMEEAAKHGIEVIVFDRPNPINGLIVDGPMLEEKWRSFIGYINIPYCHGMTIGELAQFFNEEYKVGCKLKVIPMKGWNRSMSFRDTGLAWIPPSPNVPEPDTPYFCPSTGILGELGILNIGIGFTLPFKVVGAPWIHSQDFADKLNAQKLPGVYFQPYTFRPFWGLYKGLDCQGILIHITNPKIYKPLAVQFLILGILKSLYPQEFSKRLAESTKKDLFCKANGTDKVYDLLVNEKYPAWKLIELHKQERDAFLEVRKKYLLY
ncbi:MAG: DUF1343 domain-containing protein [Verrucomicrobia bacterium]|nr:DUF1343 domain-containing protein [Verrucomicrobiota bacterium]MBU6445828.1 DUF1343 domain-containing protein [Verrucomicrobiota bacterium]MDE3046805.1 DUF1343 domain-containing protein [Verrucomicrobiota bacterium]